jgi:anti-sigma factor RsiW
MSASPDPLELNAYFDAELELGRALELESLCAADASARAQLDGLRDLRTTLREHAQAHRATAELRARIDAALNRAGGDAARPDPLVRRRGTSTWRRWWVRESYAAAIGAVAVVSACTYWLLLPAGENARIQEEVLAGHSRAVVAQRLVDVASSDHHTVKPWLSARLDYSPAVDPPAGTQLLGARIDYVDRRPVAALVFQHGGHVVDAYAWPVQGRDVAVQVTTARGFRIAHWTRAGMRHWVVSDLNPAEFRALVDALAAAG